ncbi:membrane hypothetical protein [Microcystis aeruginosa PCC 9717]|uniref:Uncharacterized protein n=1 Tax=Microcystis aeruginosa PCC 9717 TaxID=1160286 RepID=I4FLY6_MICAE|nr:membrane hypothetical protein [Microcystis aeruginosa PCC 9717]
MSMPSKSDKTKIPLIIPPTTIFFSSCFSYKSSADLLIIFSIVFSLKSIGSLILCVISLTYIGAINLCVLCVFVVRSTRWVHLIFVNLPIGIFTGKLSAKIGHYFRFYRSIPAFGG